ncbi:hypothetical protein Poli38472_003893 [Pythium oligandrum]|uniref:GST C-terminal domain-containing protein n=1 Tax=Pythium oligandrum TaxID=41045 RepID=A0A8K1CPQ0_PYTOL|nr:hypothetical protein Poli38472_003893 [Pythium oligandrum]|eukprot:TMW66128.1 hypothetical protein Poli38472_003893 [Pythium oligandrum]
MVSLTNFIENKPDAEFPAEKGRYQLYVALSCPYANRTLIAIKLKGLEEFIDVTVVNPVMTRTRPGDENDSHVGWAFADPRITPFVTGPTGQQYSLEDCSPDPVHNAKHIRDLYERVTKDSNVRYSVPLLWDKKRILSSRKSQLTSGILKVGFAPDQETRQAEIKSLYERLDRVEELLGKQRYTVGNAFTEVDIRLFVALIRFDSFFLPMFKLPKRVEEYAYLSEHLRDIYQLPRVKETVNFEHLQMNAIGSRMTPLKVVLSGPTVDFSAPHNRTHFH